MEDAPRLNWGKIAGWQPALRGDAIGGGGGVDSREIIFGRIDFWAQAFRF
jgi:hypothetical protein